MKFLKIFFSILMLLILVIALAISALVFFIDPNKLKPILIEEVAKKTGYVLVIDGKLSWSFYPRLSIKIAHMSLRSPEATLPFVDLREIKIATQLSELIIHRKNQLQGDIDIAAVRFANIHAQNLTTTLHWQNKQLIIQPLKASLYQGSLQASVQASGFTETPSWAWAAELKDIQLKPLLADVNGSESKIKISGLGKIKFQGITQGKTKDEILSHLNGSGSINVDTGIVEGVDLNYLVQFADALINKQPTATLTNLRQTVFNQLTTQVFIKDGTATINDLLLLSVALNTKGTGTINLVEQTMHMALQVQSQQTLKTQWTVPILITGYLTHPDIQLDTIEIEKWVVKQQLNQLKEKANEQIKKHIPGKTGEFLQKLLGK